MKTHRPGTAAVLLACTSLLAAPCVAQVRSEVTVSNLRHVLVDLTPDDGAAPWFRSPVTDSGPVAVAAFVTPTVGSEQRAVDYAERNGAFEFSPNTRLSIGLDVDIAMRAEISGGMEQTGTVWAVLMGGATWGPPKDSWERRSYGDVYGDVGLVFGEFRPRVDRGETLWLTFENDSGYAAWGDYRILLESTAYAAAAPVPEAPGPAMLAIGAGLLGVLGRRRIRARIRAM